LSAYFKAPFTKISLNILNIILLSVQSDVTVFCESDRRSELNKIGEYTFAKMADVLIMITETYLRHAVFIRAYLQLSNSTQKLILLFMGALEKKRVEFHLQTLHQNEVLQNSTTCR
jgi:hypothetical protein